MALAGKEFRSSGRRLFWESPDRLVLTEGGGCLSLVVGALIAGAGFYGVLAGNAAETFLPEWLRGIEFFGFNAVVLLGCCLAFLGLSVLTWRAKAVFDRKTDIWTRRSSIFYILGLRRSGKVHDLEAVHMERRGRPRIPSKWSYFPVLLRARLENGRTVEFHLGTWDNEETSQEVAAVVRYFFSLPVLDEA